MPRSVGIFVAQQNRETLGSFTDSPMFLWLSLGAILGALFIRFARSRSPDGELRFFAGAWVDGARRLGRRPTFGEAAGGRTGVVSLRVHQL